MSDDPRRERPTDEDLTRRAADEVIRQVLLGRPEPVRGRPARERERKSFREG